MRLLRWGLVGLALAATGCFTNSGTSADEPTDLDAESDSAAIDTGSSAEGGTDSFALDTGAGGDTTVGPDTGGDTAVAPDTAIAPDTMPPPDTTPVDTGADTGCDESKCGVLPTGGKRVALVDRSVPCPTGWTATDVVEANGADVCSCSCAVTTKATCPGAGAIAVSLGGSSSCGGFTGTAASGGTDVCTPIGVSVDLPDYFRGTAIAAVGGLCTPTLKADKPGATRMRRLCEPKAGQCATPMCAGTPFLECIDLPITGSCPAPFSTRRTVGSDFTLSCPSCTCGPVSASCTGTLQYFDKADCTGSSVTVVIDGTCSAIPGGAKGGLESHKYKPNPPSTGSCPPSFTASSGTKIFIGPRELCCR